MHNWFECKIKYEKTAEEGKIVRVNEAYLIDALSFTEAEARIIEEMRPFISGEFKVANIRRAKINEMFFNENGDKWYRAKVMFVSLDEEKVWKNVLQLPCLCRLLILKRPLMELQKV